MSIKDLFNMDDAVKVTGGGGGGGGSSPSIRITASSLLTVSQMSAKELDLVEGMSARFLWDSGSKTGLLTLDESGPLTFRSRGDGEAVYLSFRGVGSKIGLDVEHAVTLPYEAHEGDVYIDFTPAFEAMVSGEYESDDEDEAALDEVVEDELIEDEEDMDEEDDADDEADEDDEAVNNAMAF